MRTFINTCGIVFILAVLLTFSIENSHRVPIRYYTNIDFDVPAWALVLVPFFVGIIMGNLLDVIQRLRLNAEVKKLKKETRIRPGEGEKLL